MSTFLIDHVGWILGLGSLIAAWSVFRSGRRLWLKIRQWRNTEGKKPWLATAGALVGLVVSGGLLYFFGEGWLKMGPSLIEQVRMRGEAAPELSFVHVTDSAAASLDEYRGQVVLLNFWATWCPPCRAEMPDLDRLQTSLGDSGLVVLQVSREDLPTLEAFLDATPMSTVHGQSEAESWPVPGLPTTFVIDREGVVRRALTGPRSFEQFEEIVRKYL